ncbi:MAG: peptide chain release factor N(5)-glutamine methyltransferase, partial [Candidatus Methylomirabilales bacterium]
MTGEETATLAGCLEAAGESLARAGIETARLDAECLLAHLLGTDRVGLIRGSTRPISREVQGALGILVGRRCAGEPVAYLIGEWEFWSRPFRVTPAVLVPRPETETLVEALLERFAPEAAGWVVDVGTGSGILAVTLATERPRLHLVAADRSPEALMVARVNAERHGVASRVSCVATDLLRALRRELGKDRWVAVVANLPYVARGILATLPASVSRFEPRVALDGGPDGLEVIRRLISEARLYLCPGGLLALEIGYDQGGAARGVMV